jgi:hypothetical protein
MDRPRAFTTRAHTTSSLATTSPALPTVPYRAYEPWVNWDSTARCVPAWTFYPQRLEDLVQIVEFARAAGKRLRVAASGHSWSALVPTNDILVCIHGLNRVSMDLSDAEQPRVVIESGATVEQVNEVLERHGYALPLNVVLESVRFGGLIATGSHGSGWNNPTLSDLVTSLEIVTGTGEVRTFAMGVESDEVMNAARLSLGLFGIIYRITLRVQQSWHVRARDQRLPLADVLGHLPDLVPAHDNIDLFWWPFCERLWVKTWDRTDTAITDRPRKRPGARLSDSVTSRILREGLRMARTVPSLTPTICQALFHATPSQRDQVVAIVEAIHYRRAIEVTKMGCVEVAFKIDPAFDHVKLAMQTVLDMTRVYAARGDYPFNVTMNVRFIHQSACWLSPAFGPGHTCYVEILSAQHTRGWERFSGEVAQQWFQLPQARVHWAKEFRHIPGVIEHIRRESGPQIARFNAIKERLHVDPDHLFVNDALGEVFG